MVTLYSFGPNFGLEDPSPFVLKVITYCKVAGIPYQSKANAANLSKAPKGKLPFIEDQGQIIADSFFIIQHFQHKAGTNPDQHLSDEQKAVTQLAIKSIEESLYWCIVYYRWLDADSWPVIKQAFFGGMPQPLRFIVPVIAKRKVKANLIHQGIGRHSDQEVLIIAQEILNNLSILLGDKNYFFNNQVSLLDIVAYAFLSQIMIAEGINNPLIKTAREYTNLVDFCQRIHQHYFTDQTGNV